MCLQNCEDIPNSVSENIYLSRSFCLHNLFYNCTGNSPEDFDNQRRFCNEIQHTRRYLQIQNNRSTFKPAKGS